MNITAVFDDALRSSRFVRRILTVEDPGQQPAAGAAAPLNGDSDPGKSILRRRKPFAPKDTFTKEAYRISGHISELGKFLRSIRGPFLDLTRRLPNGLDARPVSVAFPVISSSGAGSPQPKTIIVTTLSGKEKDEIEIELKKYLKIVANEIQVLRKEVDRLPDSVPGSILSTMTEPLSVRNHRALLREHRIGVVWFLDKKLMDASTILRQLMEERAERDMKKRDMMRPRAMPILDVNQFEQLRTTSSTSLVVPTPSNIDLNATPTFSLTRLTNAAFGRTGRSPSQTRERSLDRARARSHSRESRSPASAPGSFVAKESEDPMAAGPLIKPGSSLESLVNSSNQFTEDDLDSLLTPAQKMELERENETLLRELEDNMEQVWKATQSIQEISQLQSQLAFHLQSQQDVIERLHDEAIHQTDNVMAANEQLRSAQKRFGGRRTLVLVFLMVMTVALLWLDYYYS
ncbi:hypothetical protein DFJ74DRAFT_124804 [Hyaloraphidium curvatum]|nr:hypothetical protein DFJ74DRAFT_124804 [Hyaloraphidium curvatum]